jgi:hypothetical protein
MTDLPSFEIVCSMAWDANTRVTQSFIPLEKSLGLKASFDAQTNMATFEILRSFLMPNFCRGFAWALNKKELATRSRQEKK